MAAKTIKHLLAGDSWIAVSDGVKQVRDLVSGDVLIVVRPDGAMGSALVAANYCVTAAEPCISLLVAVGEIILPRDSRVITRMGAQRADQLAAAVRAGQAVRIEVIRPSDMFAVQEGPASLKDPYRAAIAAFPRRHVTVPRRLADLSSICDDIEDMFSVAEVDYSKTQVSEWLVFSFEKPSNESEANVWTDPGVQSRALRLMTSWFGEGDQLVSRILLNEVSLLQRLTGCLAASGQEYDAKWIPGYCPAEICIGLRSGIARSHVQVARIMSRIQDCFSVSVEDAGSLVVGLALVA